MSFSVMENSYQNSSGDSYFPEHLSVDYPADWESNKKQEQVEINSMSRRSKLTKLKSIPHIFPPDVHILPLAIHGEKHVIQKGEFGSKVNFCRNLPLK